MSPWFPSDSLGTPSTGQEWCNLWVHFRVSVTETTLRPHGKPWPVWHPHHALKPQPAEDTYPAILWSLKSRRVCVLDTPIDVGGVLSLRAVKPEGTRENNPIYRVSKGLRLSDGRSLSLGRGRNIFGLVLFIRKVLMLFHTGIEVTISRVLYMGSHLSPLKTLIFTL